MSNTTDELRAQAASIAAGYFMATSGDCVALTNEIYKLIHRTQLESRIYSYETLPSAIRTCTCFPCKIVRKQLTELQAALEKQA